MPATSLARSPSVGELLKEGRHRLGYTLRDVERLTSAQGNLIPFSTLARIEQGRLDPGVKRLHALLQLYGLPIQAAGDLLALEAIAGRVSAKGDLATLSERGTKAWQKGDLATAIACYLAMRRRASLDESDRAARHESIMTFAVMAAKLGKHYIARQMLDELVLDKPAQPMLVRILVQTASSWHALGSPDCALAMVGGAESLLLPGDRRERGWLLHVRASIQLTLGAFDEANTNLLEAARLFDKAKKPYDRALVLVAMARLEVERGDATAAVRAARRAAEFASFKRFTRVHALAAIQEARALLLCDKAQGAIKVLTRILAKTAASSDNVMRFYSHYYLSKAYANAGDSRRSQVENDHAKHFVQYVDQRCKEASEVRGHSATSFGPQ